MKPDSPLRRGRRFAAVALTATVVAGLVPAVFAPTATAGAIPSAIATQTVAWGSCGVTLPPGAPALECATVTVPRDWANPGAGPALQVAISRVAATDPAQREGILFTNPGGPSGSGITVPYTIALAQPEVSAAYDIVGMDPRGVGRSTQLLCDVELDAVLEYSKYDTRDVSPAAVASRDGLAEAIADGCAANPLTPYVNTWQTIHDMDLVRALLGESELNYLGYSYGTWLGAKYAAVFPANAGKMVLDSNTAWMDDLSDSWELMPLAFQRRWAQQFFPYAARNTFFSKHVGATTAAVNTSYERSRAAYARYIEQLGGGVQGGARFDGIMTQGLYTDQGLASNAVNLGLIKVCLADNTDWSGDALTACTSGYINDLIRDLPAQTSVVQSPVVESIQALNGDLAKLVDVRAGGGIDPLQVAVADALQAPAGTDTVPLGGVYYSVRCGDGGQWHTPAWWHNYQSKLVQTYPLAGYQITGMEVCAHWTLPTHELPNPDPAKVGTMVTVQAEFDAATAYESTNRNVGQYKAARLVAVQDGGQHGQYAIAGNSCVNDVVNAWLLDDVTPSARTVCNAIPLLFETAVFPRPGPVDSKATPRSARAVIGDPQLQQELNDLVDNAG